MDDKTKKRLDSMTKSDWEELYHTRGLKMSEIAKLLGISKASVSRILKRVGIEARNQRVDASLIISREELYELYIEKRKSFLSIGKMYGVSDKIVKKLCVKYGIPVRKNGNKLYKDEVIPLYVDQGMTAVEIGKKLNVSYHAVLDLLKKNGVEITTRKGEKGKLIPYTDEIIELYESGMPSTKIAESYGVTYGPVLTLLRNNGINIKAFYEYNDTIPEDIRSKAVSLYKSGMSLSECGIELGISTSSVANILKEYGVATRTKSESKKGARNNMYGKHHSKETRTKMSMAYTRGIRGIHHMFGRGHHEQVIDCEGNTITVRSSWEGAVVRYFNARGVKYAYEPERILVDIDGVQKSYTPDFFVESGIDIAPAFVEVKGVWKDGDKGKIKAARELGYNIVVWEGKDLQRLGILDNSFKPLEY